VAGELLAGYAQTYFGTPFVKLISEALKYPNPPNERLPIRVAKQRNKLGSDSFG